MQITGSSPRNIFWDNNICNVLSWFCTVWIKSRAWPDENSEVDNGVSMHNFQDKIYFPTLQYSCCCEWIFIRHWFFKSECWVRVVEWDIFWKNPKLLFQLTTRTQNLHIIFNVFCVDCLPVWHLKFRFTTVHKTCCMDRHKQRNLFDEEQE